MRTKYESARRMRSFYEPGYFGGTPTGYGQAFQDWATDMPTQMGGFTLGPDPDAEDLPGGFGPAIRRSMRAKNAYEQPPVGVSNLGGYGVGQLQNYGVGALAAYDPLAREEHPRWRR